MNENENEKIVCDRAAEEERSARGNPAEKRRGRDTFALQKSPVFGIVVVMLFTLGIVLMPGEKLGALLLGEKGVDARNLGNALFRIVGAGVMVWLATDLGLRIFGLRKRLHGFLWALPFLVVAVDNLPIVGLARGEVSISAGIGSWMLFAFHCLSVGLFEEIVFRGVIFPLILQKAPHTRKGIFWSLMLSSALFGAVHLVNLLSSDPLSVLMQIGYSFLVGAMCGMVFLLCRNIFACAFLHALFNFCGLMADELGSGVVWDAASIVLTAVVAAAAVAYGIWLMVYKVDGPKAFLLFGEEGIS